MPGLSAHRYKPGTNRTNRRYSTSPDVPAGHVRPNCQSPGQHSPSRANQQTQDGPNKSMPSPDGQASRTAGDQRGRGWAGGGQGVASCRPPSGATALRQADGMPHQPQRARSVAVQCPGQAGGPKDEPRFRRVEKMSLCDRLRCPSCPRLGKQPGREQTEGAGTVRGNGGGNESYPRYQRKRPSETFHVLVVRTVVTTRSACLGGGALRTADGLLDQTADEFRRVATWGQDV